MLPVVVERVNSNFMKNVETATELVALDVEADCSIHESAGSRRRQVLGDELLGRAYVCHAGSYAVDETQTTGARWFRLVHRVSYTDTCLHHLSVTCFDRAKDLFCEMQ